MNARIANNRRIACANCPSPCATFLAGKVDHSDPAVSCERGIWHIYTGAGGVTPAPQPLPSLKGPEFKPNATWAELHTRYLNWNGSDDSAWLFADFAPRIRINGTCQCKRNFLAYIQSHPIDWSNAFAYFVELHNEVNRRVEREQPGQKRPTFTLSQALQRWSLSPPK